MKLLFAPVRVISGLLAGLAGKKLFERLWGALDGNAPPRPESREAAWPRLAAALLIEGAIFRLVKGAVDHAARGWFAQLTGRWPGEKAPK